MASEFQKKKLMHLFNTFYDYNGDGVIEWEDFDSLIKRVCEIHKWDPKSEMCTKNIATLKTVWESLLKYADKDCNGKITPCEWNQMWEECYKKKGELPDWQLAFCNFFFDITDTSGDGIVDSEEYKTVYGKGFNFSDAECKEAYDVISGMACELNKWANDGPEAKTHIETLKKIWESLKEAADKNSDGRITEDEWTKMWTDSYEANKNKPMAEKTLPEWQIKFCDFFFAITDTSGDGKVDKDEYTTVYQQFKCSKADCEASFNIIANGKAEVDREGYQVLWKEFVMSDDPNAPGNKLFGVIKN